MQNLQKINMMNISFQINVSIGNYTAELQNNIGYL